MKKSPVAEVWSLHVILLGALFCLSAVTGHSTALATVFNYSMVSGQVRNVDAATNYASLEAAKTADGWTGGDTINLLAGQTEDFIGRLMCNTNGLTVNFNGNTVTAAPTPTTNAVVIVQGDNVKLFGPGGIRNTATGGSAGRLILVDSSTNDINDFIIRDLYAVQQTSANGVSPIYVTNAGVHGTSANLCSGTFERVRFDGVGLAGNYRDVWLNDAKSAKGRSRLWIVDCEFSGATSTGGAGGGTSNNVISADGDADVFVIGGKFHTSGGAVIDITDTLGSSVWVIGAEVWNGGAIAGVGTEHHGGMYVTGAINNYVHHCWSGIKLIEGQGTSATVSTSVAWPSKAGFTAAIGNYVVRDPTREPPSQSTECFGIRVASQQAVIENNVITDWDHVTTNGSNFDAAISIPNNNTGALVRNNVILRAHRGISSSSRSGVTLDLFNNLIQSKARTHPGGTPAAPAAVWFTGTGSNLSALQYQNCVFISEPIDNTWLAGNNYVVQLSSGTTAFGNQRGNSYFWRNGNVTNAFNTGAPAASDLSTSGSATQPMFDAWGRLYDSSPGVLQAAASPYSTWTSEPWTVDVGDLSTNKAGGTNYWPAGSNFDVRNLNTPIATDTAQAVSATTITLAAGDAATNDAYNGWYAYTVSASGGGADQRALIQDYVASTKVATLANGWSGGTTPSGTVVYAIERPLTDLTCFFPEPSATAVNTSEIGGHYRRINSSKPTSTVGVTNITLRPGIRTATATYVAAQGVQVVILPPMLPGGGQMQRYDQVFLRPQFALGDSPFVTDVFGRVHRYRWSGGMLRQRPGPFAETPARRDFRRDASYDPGLTGRRARIDDVIPSARGPAP